MICYDMIYKFNTNPAVFVFLLFCTCANTVLVTHHDVLVLSFPLYQGDPWCFYKTESNGSSCAAFAPRQDCGEFFPACMLT